MTRFVLVGAEGMADLALPNAKLPGIRTATADEEAAFRAGLEPLCKEQGIEVRDYFIDRVGRPYWLVAVEENAHPVAVAKAEKYKRVRYLFD